MNYLHKPENIYLLKNRSVFALLGSLTKGPRRRRSGKQAKVYYDVRTTVKSGCQFYW